MEFYWLLISHIPFLFPIIICLHNFKVYKNYQSLYISLNLIFTVSFSIFYHSYDYKLTISQFTYYTISILDHWAASSVILTTLLYFVRLRTEIFYNLSYLVNTIMLVIRLHNSTVLSIAVISLGIIVSLYRIKIIIRVIKNFYYISFITSIIAILAIYCFFKALQNNYMMYHSLWHFFVSLCAGCLCILRHKYDRKFIPDEGYLTRVPTNSM